MPKRPTFQKHVQVGIFERTGVKKETLNQVLSPYVAEVNDVFDKVLHCYVRMMVIGSKIMNSLVIKKSNCSYIW